MKIILDNHRVTIKEVAEAVAITFGSCQTILTDVLSTKHAAAKIVPKLISLEQKRHRMDIAQELLTTFNNDPDLLSYTF